jgi:mycoredoxin
LDVDRGVNGSTSSAGSRRAEYEHDDAVAPGVTRDSADRIDLYWRPGCGFCAMLRSALDRLGIERVEHDIWQSDDDAATVRHHANGNETVPTVVVGDTGFVNPSADELVGFLREQHPALLPAALRG